MSRLRGKGSVSAAGWLIRERLDGWAFAATGASIVLLTATIFLNLYPRVMVSSLSPRFDLTIYNAASGPYSLTVMSIVAVIGDRRELKMRSVTSSTLARPSISVTRPWPR
jgi:hypothetical protein